MQPIPLSRLAPLIVAGGLLAQAPQAQTTLTSEVIINGLQSITWVGSPPTDDRIFVTEQVAHDIELFTNDGTPIGTFMDLTGTASGSGERGLLSLAFHPDYATNGYFYVFYTYGTDGSRIERYTVSSTNPNLGDPSTGVTILEQSQPATNHNGGNLQFGPDGYLYFAFGDGGGSGDPNCNAQDGLTWHGKMIRIDVDTDDFPADPTRNYGVPADNPFVGDPNVLDEVYHLGLRNPWRWSFDAHTGDMYIGDVGQGTREEVSFAAAGVSGLNFGWKVMEGTSCFNTSACDPGVLACNDPAYTDPIHDYSSLGSGPGVPCTVIGGVVYRGCSIPELNGTYFFAEFCSNDIWTFRYDPVGGLTDFQTVTSDLVPAPGSGTAASSIRTLGVDFNGEVLIGDFNAVYRVFAESQPPITDCDGNGMDDPCEIAMDPTKDLGGDGQLDVCQSLSADVAIFSVSQGGSQTWSLHAGPGEAGKLYFVGGSLSGTAGIPTGLVTIPLTFDFYTVHTLSKPNIAPLINSFAALDGAGAATASFTAGGGLLPVALVGATAYHAYATLDASFSAVFASNAIKLEFLP
ncbi:MAG: PQQ-dependent sugar dehydrogenase [Planctomycetota bacterium]